MNNEIKHIICYSGGHSSAIVAIEVVRRFGKDNVILLNHDISAKYESPDTKRFKKEVADYLNLPITYQNYNDLPLEELPSQFDIVEQQGSFINPKTRQALCTTYLKTIPFSLYLEKYFPEKNVVIYYGFDDIEFSRIDRRKTILNDMGYESDYPLALWGEGCHQRFRDFYIKLGYQEKHLGGMLKYDLRLKNTDHFERTIYSTLEIGIDPPNDYEVFKHANCKGYLKAGQQHWYVVYCNDRKTFNRARLSEARIGYSIIHGGVFLRDLVEKFEKMRLAGVPVSEHVPSGQFWSQARKFIKKLEEDQKPCECSF